MIATMPARLRPPTRAHPRGDEPLDRLFERPDTGRGPVRGGITADLARLYDGDLRIPLRTDRPTVVANFVETVDGIVALDAEGRSGGGEISGFSPTDRFVMGLLRALADVVLVGAGTVRSSDGGTWTAADVSPAHAGAYARLRSDLGLAPNPTTIIATRTGLIDPEHGAFQDASVPVVVAAAPAAAAHLGSVGFGDHVRVEILPEIAAGENPLVALSRRLGAQLVVCEGGPTLLGPLLQARVVDELFLTLSPQLGGRDARSERLSLVEGAALWPGTPTWLELVSVRRAGDHLLLRYGTER
jgi:riboflavin biosynthesis pyrimidine reductase